MDEAELQARVAELETKVVNLEQALLASRRIGAAVGIVMALRHLTEDEAFQLLRTTSQHSHRKLRDIADHVVYAGDIPDLTQ